MLDVVVNLDHSFLYDPGSWVEATGESIEGLGGHLVEQLQGRGVDELGGCHFNQLFGIRIDPLEPEGHIFHGSIDLDRVCALIWG